MGHNLGRKLGRNMGRRGGLGIGQETLQELEKPFVELRPRHRLAGRLHQRIVAGTKRHRHLAQHADAHAGRAGGALDGIAVLHRVGEHRGALVGAAVRGAVDVEIDLRVLAVFALEILVAGHARRVKAIDVVALAQQGAAARVAGRGAGGGEGAREHVVLREVFAFVGRFGGGASRQDRRQADKQGHRQTTGNAGHEGSSFWRKAGIIDQKETAGEWLAAGSPWPVMR
ncbi:hypothetical protein D3C71_1310170 [compost metagenome]